MTIALLCGAIAGRILVPPWWLGTGLLFISLCIAIHLVRIKQQIGIRFKAFQSLLVCLFSIALIQQTMLLRHGDLGEAEIARLSQQPGFFHIRATVAGEPSLSASRARITLRDVSIRPSDSSTFSPIFSQTQVHIPRKTFAGRPLPVRGQIMEFQGRFERLPLGDLPDMFDYGAYLRRKNISGIIQPLRNGSIQVLPLDGLALEARFFGGLMRWRRAVLSMLDAKLPPLDAGLLRAMLFGDMGNLPASIRNHFSRTGTSHLFSVSGLHTAFLAFFIYFGCRLLQVRPRPTAWITIVLLCVYCALIGFLAPVVRASIMAFCFLIPILARRAVDSLNALSIAAFFTTLFNPVAPFCADFQFSYLCMLGLVMLTPSLNELFLLQIKETPSYRVRWWRAQYNAWLGRSLSVVFAAQLAVLPLLAVYYHSFSMVAFVANLVLVPFATYALLLPGWLMALFGLAHPAVAAALGAICSGSSTLFFCLLRLFSEIPGASLVLPTLPWWLMAAYYGLLFSGAPIMFRRAPGQREARRVAMLARVFGAFALIIWWPLAIQWGFLEGEPEKDLRITMIDVGQGDAFLLRLPNGKTILLDTGQEFMANRIEQYLHSKAINHLNAMILTHADSDHIGGAARLLGAIGVERIYTTTHNGESEAQSDLARAVALRKIPMHCLQRGDEIRGAPGLRIRVLHPADRQPRGEDPDTNEHCIVLLLEYGETSILFAGDADERTETALLSDFHGEELQADILKVAHHGSAGGTTQLFLDAVQPYAALLSVGADNNYGHPSPEVVERLRKSGCRIWSTASHGTVEFASDGHRLWVRTARDPEKRLAIPLKLGEN